jgi:hypothetical protein
MDLFAASHNAFPFFFKKFLVIHASDDIVSGVLLRVAFPFAMAKSDSEVIFEHVGFSPLMRGGSTGKDFF